MRGLRTVAERLGASAAALLATLWPAIAWAQDAAPLPTLRRSPAAWIGIAIVVALAGVIIAVSLMPSKRGHQD